CRSERITAEGGISMPAALPSCMRPVTVVPSRIVAGGSMSPTLILKVPVGGEGSGGGVPPPPRPPHLLSPRCGTHGRAVWGERYSLSGVTHRRRRRVRPDVRPARSCRPPAPLRQAQRPPLLRCHPHRPRVGHTPGGFGRCSLAPGPNLRPIEQSYKSRHTGRTRLRQRNDLRVGSCSARNYSGPPLAALWQRPGSRALIARRSLRCRH